MDPQAQPQAVVTLVGELLLVLAIALPLAFLVSLSLLAIYLRAVKRSMRVRTSPPAGAEAGAAPQHLARPPRAPLTIDWRASELIASAAFEGTSAFRSASAVCIVAGLVFAMAMAAAYIAVNNLVPNVMAVVFLISFYAWPTVIAASLILSLSWRQTAGIVLLYASITCIFAGLAVMSKGIAVRQLLEVWYNLNWPGTVLALLFLARPIRAVGPLVAVFMIAAVAGALALAVAAGTSEWLLYPIAEIGTRLHLGPIGTPVAILLVGAAIAAIVGWVLLRWLGHAYRIGLITDQSIMIDAIFLMFALEYGTGLASSQKWGFAAALGAFLVYKLTAHAGFRILGFSRYAPDAPKLLLLRVFSLGKRSGKLFAAFSKRWRYRGPVRMIAGPDLATSVVEPHEFLDFMSGRLQRAFISSRDDLYKREGESVPVRDFDGRFRVASYFCHDDTWRMVLGELVQKSDAVLMDLRGFTPANRGCVYEIEELLARVPLTRLLLIADGTTDQSFLEETLRQGWAKIGDGSPNWNEHAPRVRIYQLGGDLGREVPRLVEALQRAS